MRSFHALLYLVCSGLVRDAGAFILPSPLLSVPRWAQTRKLRAPPSASSVDKINMRLSIPRDTRRSMSVIGQRMSLSFRNAYIHSKAPRSLLRPGQPIANMVSTTSDAGSELGRFESLISNSLRAVGEVRLGGDAIRMLQGISDGVETSSTQLSGLGVDSTWRYFEIGLDAFLRDPSLNAMQHWFLGRVFRSLNRAVVTSLGPDVMEASVLIDNVAQLLSKYIESHFRPGQLELYPDRANMLASMCIRLLVELEEELTARFPLSDLDETTATACGKVFKTIESVSSDFCEDEVPDAYRVFLEREVENMLQTMDLSSLKNRSSDRHSGISSYFDPVWRLAETVVDLLKYIDVIPLEGRATPVDEVPDLNAIEKHIHLLDPANSVKYAWVKMVSRKIRQECNLSALESADFDEEVPNIQEISGYSRTLFDYGRSIAAAGMCGWHLYSNSESDEVEDLWLEHNQDSEGIDIIKEFGSNAKNISTEIFTKVLANASSVLEETKYTIKPLSLLDPHTVDIDRTLQFIPNSMRLRINSTFHALLRNSSLTEEDTNESDNLQRRADKPVLSWFDNIGAMAMAVRLSVGTKGRAALLCNASDVEIEEGLPGSSDAAFSSALGRVLTNYLTSPSFSESELSNDLISASALVEFMGVEAIEVAVITAVKISLKEAMLKCSMRNEPSSAYAELGRRIAVVRPLLTRSLLFESGSDVFNSNDAWFADVAEATIAGVAMVIIDKTAAASRNVSKLRKLVMTPETYGPDKGEMGKALGVVTADDDDTPDEDLERQVGEAYFAAAASKALIRGIEDVSGIDSDALGQYFKKLGEECGISEIEASGTLMHLASLAASQVVLGHLLPDAEFASDSVLTGGNTDSKKEAETEAAERLSSLRHMFNMYQVPRSMFANFGSKPESYIGACAKFCVECIYANLQAGDAEGEEDNNCWDKMSTLAKNIGSMIDVLNTTRGPKDDDFLLFLNLLKNAFSNLYITQGDTGLLESIASGLEGGGSSALQLPQVNRYNQK